MPQKRPSRFSALEERDAWFDIIHRQDDFERDRKGADAPRTDRAFVDAYKVQSVGCSAKTHEVINQFSVHQLRRMRKQSIPGDGRRRNRKGENGHFQRHPLQAQYLIARVETRDGIAFFEQRNWKMLLKVIKRACDQDPSLGPPPSCPKQVQRLLDQHFAANHAIHVRLKGKSKARAIDSPSHGKHRLSVERPGQIVEMDFTPVDALSPDGNLYILNAVDRFSGAAVSLVVEAVNSDAVALMIYIFSTTHFIPETIVFDNGKEAKNRRIAQAAKSMGIEIRYTLPFRGDKKGTVERFNGLINNRVIRFLRSHKGANTAERIAIRGREETFENRARVEEKLTALGKTREDLQRIIDRYVALYHNKKNRSTSWSPNEILANYQGTRPRTLNKDQYAAFAQLLAPLAGRNGRASLRRTGLRIEGHDYTAPALGDPKYMGRSFEVRRDWLEPGIVHVFDRDPHDGTLRYVGEAKAHTITGENPKESAIEAGKVWSRAVAEINARIRKNEQSVESREELFLGILDLDASQSNVVPFVPKQAISPAGLQPFSEAAQASQVSAAALTKGTETVRDETRFDRWLRLDEERRNGLPLSSRDESFHQNYQQQDEFKVLMEAHEPQQPRKHSA